MRMQRQAFGPFTFDAPSEWSPRTSVAFLAPTRPDAPPVVVSREECNPGEALATFGWRRIVELTRLRPERQLVDARPIRIADREAFLIVADHPTPRGVVREVIAYVDGGERNVLTLTFTHTGDETPDLHEAILASLQYRAQAPELQPSRTSSAPPPAASLPEMPRPAPSPPPPVHHDREDTGVYAVPMPGARARR